MHSDITDSAGTVHQVIMGRYRDTRAPAGFCFVEFVDSQACEMCLRHMDRVVSTAVLPALLFFSSLHVMRMDDQVEAT